MKFCDGLFSAIIKHKKAVVSVFAALALICGIAQTWVYINYNIVDYLPEGTNSTEAIKVMDNEFTQSVTNARVMVKNVDVPQVLESKRKLKSIDGVGDVMWLDDVENISQPMSFIDKDLLESYYKNNNAVISITIADGREASIVKEIRNVLGDNAVISGDAVVTAVSQEMSSGEAIRATIFLIPIIIIILLLSTSSYIQPFLFLCAIGVAVLINMGTGLIFGQVSFITNSISPILQMAVSLDYAIFLLHSFDSFRQTTDDVEEAMKKAMIRSLPSVMASALTTLFGFLALVFMRFGIGSDLGINLAKGIVMSLVSVMVFLPALTLVCYKLLDKTKHKAIMLGFSKTSKFIHWVRIPVFILVLLLVVPSFLAQKNNTFMYGIGTLGEDTQAGRDEAEINSVFGKSTPIVMLVPKGDVAKETALCNDLQQVDNVTSVISYVTMVGAEIPQAFLDEDVKSQFYSENYCRIIIYASTDQEGDEAFETVANVRNVASSYYGDSPLTLGQSVNLYDIKDVITQDNLIVNILAIISIGLVLLFTFKSISLPLILLMTIETSIWINLAVPYFNGTWLCYIGFLVISTVQLGATVDYAILFTDNFKENRKSLCSKDAILKTVKDSMGSIIMSASILSLAGIVIQFTSSNDVVSQLGGLLGRGTIISASMVLLFLPAYLSLFDKIIEKTTLHCNFFKKGDASNE